MVKHSAIFETLELGLRKQDQLLRPLETSKHRSLEILKCWSSADTQIGIMMGQIHFRAVEGLPGRRTQWVASVMWGKEVVLIWWRKDHCNRKGDIYVCTGCLEGHSDSTRDMLG